MLFAALLFLVALLAFANGANDVSKGVATLAGSGAASYRRALLWGTAWTIAGALLGGVVAMSLAERFARSLGDVGTHGAALPLSVVVGALAWVAFSTRAGLPVSTTHAIAGGIAGAGWLAQGVPPLARTDLLSGLFAPLLLSPFLALALTFLMAPLARRVAHWLDGRCVCAVPAAEVMLPHSSGSLAVPARLNLVMGHTADCEVRSIWGWNLSLDHAHWLSSGLVSLSRGLNDAPKIFALAMPLIVVTGASGTPLLATAILLVAAAMGLGSWHSGRRVTEVLAEKVTSMDPRQGFAANLATALLVAGASRFGVPVSTTHVSSGAIIGSGLIAGRRVHWRLVGEFALAWLVTLPVTGLVAMACYALLH
jgi:PiT family inorganic phosphate transporter